MMQISAISQSYVPYEVWVRVGERALSQDSDRAVVGRDGEKAQEAAKIADLGSDVSRLLEKNVKKLENALSAFTSLRFAVDRDTEERVVRVVNRQTNEVIRQIPTEEMLTLSRRLRNAQSLLLETTA
ncbi:flagellar protein FlaG protein [Magnetococcus marinus MC-1]|uniref:Flagellar protein FlaG protein n=1 Tax=Magnetococcus marinus (strain ATCC BAA-1437 / JCM 17883 / MC-1) TaxID=156889 RepID=A0L3R9_MAGMM|nr:flagellar protein FlaG [Magnetococcus marinus]ABK42612.1 flagellar protein FlaG protein [Magnetococcus marinus MC-1]